MNSIGQNIANAVLLSQNMKRGVIFEKYLIPSWFNKLINDTNYQYSLQYAQSNRLYRILLRVLNGDVITITHGSEAQVNKWNENPEVFPIGFANLIIDYGIVGIESGNEEFQEEHYDIYSR